MKDLVVNCLLIILMNKTTIIIIIYIIGILIAALFGGVWDADTSFIKTMSVFLWTIIFLIVTFYFERHDSK